MATIGNLYSKSILVRLTNSKGEDKYKSINITVDYQVNTVPIHKTELIIKLTDEQDPFFLYSLYMSEEDYQNLKIQQGLLVDFHAFGQRFIDLLCACEKDEKVDNPKFQLQFFSKEPLPFDHGHANLNVIEINPFKHLCHLSLGFTPGNDADVKKYLAGCLKTLRDDHIQLNRQLDDTRSTLMQKLETTQQALSNKTIELDKLRIELDNQSERLQTKHIQELNFERDKAMQNQFSTQQKYEKEKKDIEQNLMKTIKQLEQRLVELELNNKDLLDKKYRNESQLQELRLKSATVQEELDSAKSELANIRKQNTSLDSELHSNEKVANQLRTRIAVLEQELKDKVEGVQRASETLHSEQSQRKRLDELLKEKSAELKKKQNEVGYYVKEFEKGSELLKKMREREKSLMEQMKIKTKILNQQEKVMNEREKQIDELNGEIKDLKKQLSAMGDETKDLGGQLQKKKEELEEATRLLKRDENIISWLNKQLTDNNIATSSGGGNNKFGTVTSSSNLHNYESGNSVVAFRPFGTLMSSTSNNNTNLMNGGGNLSSASSMNTYNAGGLHIDSALANNTNNLLRMNSSHTPPLSSNTLVNSYQPRASAMSSTSSSSIQNHQNQQNGGDVSKENHEINSPILSHRDVNAKLTTITSNPTGSTTTNGMTRLDPKYFQTTNNPTNNYNMDVIPIKQHLINKQQQQQQQQQQAALMSSSTSNTTSSNGVNGGANSIRINKQLIHPLATSNSNQAAANTALPSKSTPSLASAYFPMAN